MLNKPGFGQKRIHLILFVITLITTTIAGAEWMTGRSLFYGPKTITADQIVAGLQFSIPFLLILTCHEFGHYFVAQYHKVKVTLPYYIPLWLGFVPFLPSIGTMGALIRIKENVNSRKKYFDIGVAGPLAGFVIAIFVLIYGFVTLPGIEYIYNIHPDYRQYGNHYTEYIHTYEHHLNNHIAFYKDQRVADSIAYFQENGTIENWTYPDFKPNDQYVSTSFIFGKTILFSFLEDLFVSDRGKIPSRYEASHYPLLLAGFLALFFTSLNLLPIGQLDGGHILYGLIGPKKFRYVSSGIYLLLLYYAGLGIVNPYKIGSDVLNQIVYFVFLYFCFIRFTPNQRDRWMFASIVYFSQFITVYFYPEVTGYTMWLLFAFILGRFLGINHPPVEHDEPLSQGRKVLGWTALFVFVICFSPRPFIVEQNIYDKSNKSETPIFLSTVNPSPYSARIECPNSDARASSNFMNCGDEMSVLAGSPSGSKNCDLNAFTASILCAQKRETSTTRSGCIKSVWM